MSARAAAGGQFAVRQIQHGFNLEGRLDRLLTQTMHAPHARAINDRPYGGNRMKLNP